MTVEVGRLSEQHGGGGTDQLIEKQAGWEEQSTTPLAPTHRHQHTDVPFRHPSAQRAREKGPRPGPLPGEGDGTIMQNPNHGHLQRAAGTSVGMSS